MAALSATAPGTLASPVTNRVISYGVRLVGYLGDTALLLFVGNLTERELPRAKLAWLLGLVGLYTIAGGLLGVFFSHLHFTSPLAAIVPNRLQSGNQVLQAQLHPAFAQLQSVLGTSGRPDAPFAYTNIWGNCLALLLPWLIAQWWFRGTRRQRLIAAGGLRDRGRAHHLLAGPRAVDRADLRRRVHRLPPGVHGAAGRARRPDRRAGGGRRAHRGHPAAGHDQPAAGQRGQ